ncbi:MAG: cation diffusion facilitator family transporter [Candidatus Obscuribacterales bacterium]
MPHSNCEHEHNLQESPAQSAPDNHKHSHDHFEVRQQSRSKLTIVLALTTGFMFVEAAAGWYTGSLALIADAGHMLGDVAALALALFAVWLSSKPAGRSRTYGFHRSEILAALANSVLLVVISIAIFCEAIHRLSQPPEIHSVPMLVVAVLGLIVNLISMKLLGAHSHGSLNAKAAYLEVFADMLASCAVIVAGLVIMFTGWYLADPILSAILSIFIVSRTWGLLKESVEILMESAPREFDLEALTKAFLAVGGVVQVHDLHVWTITSGLLAMSCHLTIEPQADSQTVLNQVNALMEKDFKISHTTIQIELADSDRKCNDICAVS